MIFFPTLYIPVGPPSFRSPPLRFACHKEARRTAANRREYTQVRIQCEEIRIRAVVRVTIGLRLVWKCDLAELSSLRETDLG